MNLDLFSVIVLLGALQALIFSVYLYISPADNKIQKRSLAFFVFILSYNGFETLNWSSELYRYLVIFDLFPFILVFGLGPSIYLYVRSFRTSAPIYKAWRYYVFVWAALIIRFFILVIWQLEVQGIKTVFDLNVLDYWYGAIAEPLSVIVFTSGVILAFREYQLLMQENPQQSSWLPDEKSMIRRWLTTLLTVMTVFSLLWIGTVSLPFIYDIGDQKYYVIEVALVVFIYWIGYTGYHRNRIIYINQQKKMQASAGSLTAEDVEYCLAELENAMNVDQLYLNPELNIGMVATHISISPKKLSAVLNQVLDKGFSEYVNSWRVEAVKQMILDPSRRNMTITGIAYDCGFNSQPTFQRAFKAFTGQTPSEYMQNSIQIQN